MPQRGDPLAQCQFVCVGVGGRSPIVRRGGFVRLTGVAGLVARWDVVIYDFAGVSLFCICFSD